MKEQAIAERLFQFSLALATGIGVSFPSLSGMDSHAGGKTGETIVALFKAAVEGYKPSLPEDHVLLLDAYEGARRSFVDFYTTRSSEAARLLYELESTEEREERARIVSEIWAPELAMSDEAILERWQLQDVRPNPHPLSPEEIVLQLNALYTIPTDPPGDTDPDLLKRWEALRRDPGPQAASYDHPVPLFEEKSHELMDCLDELDGDIAFEKRMEVLPGHKRIPVLVSLSVTHPRIDELAGKWIRRLVEGKEYDHLEIILLTETGIRRMLPGLLGSDFPLFTVLGSYGAHFNALKYAQLLLEKSHGVRAGFKLDTDEGIRSEDLFRATGRTWLQTLCHPFWGGTARDWSGREVILGINEGEYVNSSDIERLGYAGALRCPDVLVPPTRLGPDILFAKAFAHGRATGLYNTFDSVTDYISHPVVKGGGYGITNDALKTGAPFTLSIVGRAEDQQFYFSGLSSGIRGIFHPSLRIAHYKDRVAGSEGRTVASRFVGDMVRLLLFGRIAELLGVKDDIDPMPGIFASSLSRAQSFFHTLLRAQDFAASGNPAAEGLMESLTGELRNLIERIEEGDVERLVSAEAALWREFIGKVSPLENDRVKLAIAGLQVS